ncbi:MAG: hypothetical protein NTY45_06790 [Elusimicrobia bacterium]|nr:hypothetical protein [Elusimicrobiota bacterium]
MKIGQLAELNEWIVRDVPAELGRVKYIFILESPHKKELENKCPAAGTAGKAMARFILGDTTAAFGKLIFDGKTGARYGIVNVCPVPMQASAYTGLSAEQKSIVKELGRIRNPQLKNVDAGLYAEILADLAQRLSKAGQAAKLIPCGKFARKALAAIRPANPYDIPHPSFGNWHKKKYKAALDALKAELSADR